MQYEAIILAQKKKFKLGCLNLGTLGNFLELQWKIETSFTWSKAGVNKDTCVAAGLKRLTFQSMQVE